MAGVGTINHWITPSDRRSTKDHPDLKFFGCRSSTLEENREIKYLERKKVNIEQRERNRDLNEQRTEMVSPVALDASPMCSYIKPCHVLPDRKSRSWIAGQNRTYKLL
ncbi:hypothetical protein M0802_010922 [Mischocyttarus mexicanus]|nr:hypothetical protein M0802_010922 [Mischocyttarus mexicanus]